MKNIFKRGAYKYIIQSAKRTERQRIIDALKEDLEGNYGSREVAVREYIEDLIKGLEDNKN